MFQVFQQKIQLLSSNISYLEHNDVFQIVDIDIKQVIEDIIFFVFILINIPINQTTNAGTQTSIKPKKVEIKCSSAKRSNTQTQPSQNRRIQITPRRTKLSIFKNKLL
ncbi:Hypothetical_protein [Hexamita inflata]|uniref:Hypothetical_protein n=1 Tax=Hexamita inflata TaxID=28002 RepID=A0AA86R0H8_9EUKA|nr:Hypothetical protein HINF_LOCUS55018 [Hexamita inflata]